MPLSDGLEDYERMISRSIKVWLNFLWEIRDEPATKAADMFRCLELERALRTVRDRLPIQDQALPTPAGLWKDLESEFEFLHKRLIHSLPDREFTHRKIRVIDELIINLKSLSQKPNPN